MVKSASVWLQGNYHFIPAAGCVLDLACGGGRHAKYLDEKGFDVVATDINIAAISKENLSHTTVIEADLENTPWPFEKAQFDAIVVVNYLWRPQFPSLIESLKPGGVVVFDTFMIGNEEFGRPSNPKFLLKSGELKQVFSDFELLAFEEGLVEKPIPAMRQSIVARKLI